MLNATAKGDQQLVKTMLKPFIDVNGTTNYFQLLMVPVGERIPAMAKADRQYVHKILSAQIEFTMKYFNLKNGMSLEQIFLLSDEIINESESDNLSVQDVYLFLAKLAAGKMGTVYDRLDVATMMELLEKHRQERHEELLRAREEQHAQNKILPVNDRLADMFPNNEKTEMHNAMADYLRKQNEPGRSI